MEVKYASVDRATGETTMVDHTLSKDECNRADTTLETLASLKPVLQAGQVFKEGKTVTAGNASQQSDGASACVLMEAKEAERRGLEPLGAFRGFAVAGCEPDEMGIGPVFAVPRLLERQGLKVDDIDLWELNEAFASQCLYSRDKLGVDPEKYNSMAARDLDRPPLRHDGRALRRTCAARGPAAKGQVWGGDDVHWRRDGSRRPH